MLWMNHPHRNACNARQLEEADYKEIQGSKGTLDHSACSISVRAKLYSVKHTVSYQASG